MSKITQILAQPVKYVIEGIDVSIYPLDFEDTMKLLELKKSNNEKNEIVMDKDGIKVIKEIMVKKLKQSFTEIKENGQKIEPTDEEINKINVNFYSKYMEKLFEMINSEEGSIKKK